MYYYHSLTKEGPCVDNAPYMYILGSNGGGGAINIVYYQACKAVQIM